MSDIREKVVAIIVDKLNVEESAMKGWVRGGADTRTPVDNKINGRPDLTAFK